MVAWNDLDLRKMPPLASMKKRVQKDLFLLLFEQGEILTPVRRKDQVLS